MPGWPLSAIERPIERSKSAEQTTQGTDSICGFGRTKRIFDRYTPPSPYKDYGTSKYLGEKYILDKSAEGKIDGTSLRGFWFFGPFMPARNDQFFRMFDWPRQVVFGNGRNFRSISHVDNTVQAFLKAGKFHKDIAGSIDAAVEDFNYDPDVDLESAAREIPDLLV